MRKLLFFFFLAALPLAAAAHAIKIAPDLNLQGNRKVDIIVQFSTVPTENHHAQVAAKGGRLKTRLGQLKAAVYSIDSGAVAAIAELPDVAYISADRAVRGQLNYSTAAVHADVVWRYGWTGKNIGIAIVDSGIAESLDLRHGGQGTSRVVYAESFGSLSRTSDAYGHGTHVAGIAGGDGFLSRGVYRGIAPQSNLVNLRALDGTGTGSDSGVMAAIARAIELKDRYGIRVLNLSLGRPVLESYQLDPLCQAVEAAWKAGIVVVVAGGNDGRDDSAGTDGYGTILAPGNDPYVITVGAMKAMNTYAREDDLIASYSSKGPSAIDHIVKPDLVAPGNVVTSLLTPGYLSQTYPQNVVEGRYLQLSGTSMATPVVSGAAALLLEQNPSLTPDQVKARLMKTAGKGFPEVSIATDTITGASYTSYYDIFTIGAGYLDVSAALSDTSQASGSAMSPTAAMDPQTGEIFLVQDGSTVWGSTPVWSLTQIWASSAVWGSSAVSGDSVVWGSAAIGTGPDGLLGEAMTVVGER